MKKLTEMYLKERPEARPKCPYCLGDKITARNRNKRVQESLARYQTPRREKASYQCSQCDYIFLETTILSVYDRLSLIGSEVEALQTGTNMFSIDTLVEHTLRVFHDASGVWGMFLSELCDNATRGLLLAFYDEHVRVPVPIASFEDGLRARYGVCRES